MSGTCALTVLHSVNGKHAAKRFSINRKTGEIKSRSYDNEKHFSVETWSSRLSPISLRH